MLRSQKILKSLRMKILMSEQHVTEWRSKGSSSLYLGNIGKNSEVYLK